MPAQLAQRLQQVIDNKTKPLGSLGFLEQVALRLGLIQNTLSPAIENPWLVVFAGDHGAAAAGISPYPQDVTWQMVMNFLGGGAAVNVFARQANCRLAVVDAGVNHDFGEVAGLIGRKIGPGTRNYLAEPAMSAAQCAAAIAAGRAIAADLAGQGCKVLALGEMGIGNTSSAALIAHRLLDLKLAELVGRGAGLDDAGLARKLGLLTQASARVDVELDGIGALQEFGGFEIAMMTGAMLEAASRRMVIVIDGFIVTAALLAALSIDPAVLGFCLFSHCSGESGHRPVLDRLGATPMLNLGLRLGEGSGAALAIPLLRAAAAFLSEMASFEDAGVSRKEP